MRIEHAARGVLLALLAVLLTGCAMPPTKAGSHRAHYRVIGYDTVRDDIRPADIERIDTLIFAFAQLVDGEVVLDPAQTARLRLRTALKATHPQLKVAIAVGGWGMGGFSEAAGTAAGRQRIADSAVRLLPANDADGIDVDWEYPGHAEAGIAASPQDRANFTLLLQDVRAALDRVGEAHGRRGANHYSLSIAVADGPFVDGIDIAAVEPSLDWFNLMTYDFFNSMTPTTGHHTALHALALAPADARSTDKAVRQFLAAGVPARKLVIGAAFYGREFADVQTTRHGLHQVYGHYQGEHPWRELKTGFIDRNGYARHWDAEAKAPWLWNAATRRFISYDDPSSLAAKAAYVKTHHLGGIMYWEQSQDPDGELLDAIWRGLQ